MDAYAIFDGLRRRRAAPGRKVKQALFCGLMGMALAAGTPALAVCDAQPWTFTSNASSTTQTKLLMDTTTVQNFQFSLASVAGKLLPRSMALLVYRGGYQPERYPLSISDLPDSGIYTASKVVLEMQIVGNVPFYPSTARGSIGLCGNARAPKP